MIASGPIVLNDGNVQLITSNGIGQKILTGAGHIMRSTTPLGLAN